MAFSKRLFSSSRTGGWLDVVDGGTWRHVTRLGIHPPPYRFMVAVERHSGKRNGL